MTEKERSAFVEIMPEKREKARRLPSPRSRRMQVCFTLFVLVFLFSGTAFSSTVKPSQQQKQATVYICPMDADVKSDKPGKCPKCGMALRPESKEKKESDGQAEGSVKEMKREDGSVALGRIPDVPVLDQDGRRLHFYKDLVKGKTVAINFIFTTCTTICPPLTATFRKVQQDLGERVGRDVTLISVSVDPTVDVPERMKSFAAKFHAGPGWTFVTGSKPDIDVLLQALGAATGDKNDHTPMILVGNEATNYWTRTYGLAPARTIIKVINEAAENEHAASGNTHKHTGEAAQSSVKVPMPGETETNSPESERRVERAVQPAASTSTVPDNASSTVKASESKRPTEAAAEYFTNLTLLTQENKPVRFYDDMLKGKVVLINFIFTTCAGICPPMTANLARVQDYLGDHVGRDVNFISISVDPVTDTPDALKKYAENFKVKPGWYFLTGKKENVDWVLYKLGGYVEDKNQHTGMLIIGNEATGKWMKAFAMSRPSELADAVLKMLAGSNE